MTNRPIFTILVDYNTPSSEDGTRLEPIFSEVIVEEVRKGEIKAGDPIFIYFDPEGDASYFAEAGWGITGTIISVTLKTVVGHDGEIAMIEYKDDFAV